MSSKRRDSFDEAWIVQVERKIRILSRVRMPTLYVLGDPPLILNYEAFMQ